MMELPPSAETSKDHNADPRLERYEQLGARGALVKDTLNLVEERLIGTPDSVHGRFVSLCRAGVLPQDNGVSAGLVKFRKELYQLLRTSLRLNDTDWDAIQHRRDSEAA